MKYCASCGQVNHDNQEINCGRYSAVFPMLNFAQPPPPFNQQAFNQFAYNQPMTTKKKLSEKF